MVCSGYKMFSKQQILLKRGRYLVQRDIVIFDNNFLHINRHNLIVVIYLQSVHKLSVTSIYLF